MEYLSELHELAKKHEKQIKEAVAKRFSVSTDELELLINSKNDVYVYEEYPIFCCFVLGRKSGFLYLGTSDIDEEKKMGDFTARILS